MAKDIINAGLLDAEPSEASATQEKKRRGRPPKKGQQEGDGASGDNVRPAGANKAGATVEAGAQAVPAEVNAASDSAPKSPRRGRKPAQPRDAKAQEDVQSAPANPAEEGDPARSAEAADQGGAEKRKRPARKKPAAGQVRQQETEGVKTDNTPAEASAQVPERTSRRRKKPADGTPESRQVSQTDPESGADIAATDDTADGTPVKPDAAAPRSRGRGRKKPVQGSETERREASATVAEAAGGTPETAEAEERTASDTAREQAGEEKPAGNRGRRGGRRRPSPNAETGKDTAPAEGATHSVGESEMNTDVSAETGADGGQTAVAGEPRQQRQRGQQKKRTPQEHKPEEGLSEKQEGQEKQSQPRKQSQERGSQEDRQVKHDQDPQGRQEGKGQQQGKQNNGKNGATGERKDHGRKKRGDRHRTPPPLIDDKTDKELIINVTSNEITIALLEDKQLVELNKEKCKTGFAVGDIYLGKVRKLMPGLNAAFVNIGYEKDAFIHYLDLGPQFATFQKMTSALTANRKLPEFEKLKVEPTINKKGKISGFLSSGQPIIVQIAKEAISTKGPRLTSEISLAGRHVVLMPFAGKISISQKIRDNGEKRRLKKIAESVLPKNYGVIIRTAAVGKSDADIANDITSLVARWESALAKLKGQQPPEILLSEVNRATSIIRDLLNGSFSSIVVDDKSMYDEITEYIRTIAPEKEKIVKLYKGRTPIFDNYDISKQIQGLFSKYVSLRKGAYLIIEHTEAMHVVDVNSGNRAKVEDDQERTAMEVNLAAAAELARQLRLRDMGGIIVVDFIDLHKGDNRQALFDKMTEEMASDRAKHTILPVSKFGLMQITRQRVRPEAIQEVTEACPACGGTGKIATTVDLDQQIENQLAYFALEKGIRSLSLHVSPYLAAYLERGLLNSVRRKWSKKYKVKLEVVPNPSTGFIEARFYDREGNPLD